MSSWENANKKSNLSQCRRQTRALHSVGTKEGNTQMLIHVICLMGFHSSSSPVTERGTLLHRC